MKDQNKSASIVQHVGFKKQAEKKKTCRRRIGKKN